MSTRRHSDRLIQKLATAWKAGILLIIIGAISPACGYGLTIDFSNASAIYIDGESHLRKVDAEGQVLTMLDPDGTVGMIQFDPQGNLFFTYGSQLYKAISTNNVLTLIGDYINDDPLQFDQAANCYFNSSGYGDCCIKKWDGTGVTDILNDNNVWIEKWAVAQDGTVIIEGETESTAMRWLRKITPAGDMVSLISFEGGLGFLMKFPDNRIYFGDNNYGGYNGVYRLTDDISPPPSSTPYIGKTNDYWAAYTPDYDINAMCAGHDPDYCEPLIMYYGSHIADYTTMAGSNLIVNVGYNGFRTTLCQYCPTPEVLDITQLDYMTLMAACSNLLLIAGTKDSKNRLILYDPATTNEINLLDEEIELYHLRSLYNGHIWFDGKKFSGNRYIIGELVLTYGSGIKGIRTVDAVYTEKTTLSSRPLDFLVMPYHIGDIPSPPDPDPNPYTLIPVIKINDSESEQVTLPQHEACRVDVSLSAGDYAGQNADWWLAALAGDAWYAYSLDQGWLEVTSDGELTPVSQGPLFNLSTTTVLDTTALPVGDYMFYFGTDDEMDGVLDMDRLTYDAVRLTVE